MRNSLIIALDFPNKTEVFHFLDRFNGEKLFVKVGMELFYQEGPNIVRELKEEGHQVFLDLKLHDIPNTVKSAMRNIAGLGADLVNVHAAGGIRMMESALEGLDAGTPAGQKRPFAIAVTQLTSTSQQEMQEWQQIKLPLLDSVAHYAAITKQAGMDGVVCSPLEAALIRDHLGADFLTVTPGIRLSSDDVQDQVRVATPGSARESGVSAIVVGRSITRAQNPYESYQLFKTEWEGVTQ
ncbi:orotidine-5'-phosphate decarboxylase [Niallia taxi]|uniref:Orotidine 5'-phosphate decarboxylase n=1 Tax=Niallia taxi TaxID=2499688 RepID=A0A437KGE1_9BACI|nr:orotidine-5'-phosphate decarboxylase [Niallia taxi]MCM3214810.1 orotidine-5'-phosphate decarboxylase [Niallia taxi]MED4037750.1 orotidine-5'-phosphate decarboxylase [Niallia taxi]MED4053667.1 orotidine-5'-phosphate decarboxylase [Niallia taxi]MED4119507.1 orotidine-5'-phosphate decarboxylase [Niallia taxi]RVT67160.1 orotidine-5'-phosphate decarboxylase [Niallia taxi]